MGRQTISLIAWRFALDEENIGIREEWYRRGIPVKQVPQNAPHFVVFIRKLSKHCLAPGGLRFPDNSITAVTCNLKISGGIIPWPKQ
jgi:hypothetical protein